MPEMSPPGVKSVKLIINSISPLQICCAEIFSFCPEIFSFFLFLTVTLIRVSQGQDQWSQVFQSLFNLPALCSTPALSPSLTRAV